jgi:hypothetical protein
MRGSLAIDPVINHCFRLERTGPLLSAITEAGVV